MVSIFSLQGTIEQYAYRKILATADDFDLTDQAEQNRLIHQIHSDAISSSCWRPLGWFLSVIFRLQSRVQNAVHNALQNIGQHCNRIKTGVDRHHQVSTLDLKIDQNFKRETNKNITLLASSTFFVPYLERNFGLSKQDYDLLIHCEMRLIKSEIARLPADRQRIYNKNIKEKAAKRILNRLAELSKTIDSELIGDICLVEKGLTPRFTLLRQITIGGKNAYELLKTKYRLSEKEILSLLCFAKHKFNLPLGIALIEKLDKWLNDLGENKIKSLKLDLIKMQKLIGPLWDAKRKIDGLLSPHPHKREIFEFLRNINAEVQDLDALGRELVQTIFPQQFFDIAAQYVCDQFTLLARDPGAMSDKTQNAMDRKFQEDLLQIEGGHYNPFYKRDLQRREGQVLMIGNQNCENISDSEIDRAAILKAIKGLCGDQDPELSSITEIALASEFEHEIARWFQEAWDKTGLRSEIFTHTHKLLSKKVDKIANGLSVDYDVEFDLLRTQPNPQLLEHATVKIRLELTRSTEGTWQRKWIWNPSVAQRESVSVF